MQNPEFYRNLMPTNTKVMAICTDLGDPYNESGDTTSKNIVNDFDDLVAISMISCLEGKCNIYTTMKDKKIEATISTNVDNLLTHMEGTKDEFTLLFHNVY
jgi:hypothetical protein